MIRYHTKPTLMATRMSSSWNTMMTAYGSTTIGRNPTMSGIRTTSLYSVFENIFFSAIYMSRFFFSGLFRFFFQPPNIFPTSSSFKATSSQCLLEISFPSHATETRNFNVSKTIMHSEIFCDLCSFAVKYVIYESSSKSRNLFSIREPIV